MGNERGQCLHISQVLPQCLAAMFQAAAQGADAAGQRENGQYLADPVSGELIVDGHYRQVLFMTNEFRASEIPVTLFHDEARAFNYPVGTVGMIDFTIRSKAYSEENMKEQRFEPIIRLNNFSVL